MPITPLHFGFALPFKILRGERMSVTAFCLTNCVMDVEPVVKIIFDIPGDLHSATHSLFGVGMITLWFAFATICICRAMQWGDESRDLAYAEGIFFGGFSHLLLDAMVHTDVHPFAPLTNWNPLYFDGMGTVSLIGVVLWLVGLTYLVGPKSGAIQRARERVEQDRIWLRELFSKAFR
jgi:hypothetical protein